MPATAKICGVSTPEALDTAVAGGASHVGFVFFPPSPRNVSLDEAVRLSRRVPSHVKVVGVFVDPGDDQFVDNAIGSGELDVIQVHGAVPDKVAHLKRFSGLETWAALPIKTRADLAAARGYAGAADRLVYDAKTPDGAALPGGMGLRFDWALLDGFAHPLPWALSGGLDAANVREAIGRTGARLVDVSSGVESAAGVKDPARIAAFLEAVARA